MLDQEISVGDKSVFVHNYLLRENKKINSIEYTNLSEEKGKWFCVCKNHNVHSVFESLDKEPQLLDQQAIPSRLRFDHMPQPHCTSCHVTRAVRSYATILTSLANLQEIPEPHIVGAIGQQFNATYNPKRVQKCPATTLTMTTTVEDTTTQQPQPTPAQADTQQATMITMELEVNNMTTTSLQSTLEKFRADMKAETEATMATFCLEMQQQLDATIHAIVNDMCNSILVSVQAIMDASISKIGTAGATATQHLPST
eukprot:15361146-Ditylum_brightwellii.AAC.1